MPTNDSKSVAHAQKRQSEPGHSVNQSQIVANVQNRHSGHGKWPGSSKSARGECLESPESGHGVNQSQSVVKVQNRPDIAACIHKVWMLMKNQIKI